MSIPLLQSSNKALVPPATSLSASSLSSFHLIVTGQIESAQNLPLHIENLYCRYVLSYGPDWKVVHGITTGITQISRRGNSSGRSYMNTNTNHGEADINAITCSNNCITWNFPIEIALRSTNVYGWPRISLAVYGLDFLGRDVVRGYGSVLIPTVVGRHFRSIEMYRPISGSWCQEIMNWVSGTLPEYYETAFTSRNGGRATTRVRSDGGQVVMVLNISTKGLDTFGFQTGWYLSVNTEWQDTTGLIIQVLWVIFIRLSMENTPTTRGFEKGSERKL